MLSARPWHNLVRNDKLRSCVWPTSSRSRQSFPQLCLPVATKLLSRLWREVLVRQTLASLPRQGSTSLWLFRVGHQLQRLRSLSDPMPDLELRHMLDHRRQLLNDGRQLLWSHLRRTNDHRLLLVRADDSTRRNHHRRRNIARWHDSARDVQQLRRLPTLPVNQWADLPGNYRPWP